MRALTIAEVRRRASWIVASRLALIGGVLGAVIVSALFSPVGLMNFGVSAFLSTTLLSAAALRYALGRERPEHAVIPATIVAALANSGATAALGVLFIAPRLPDGRAGMAVGFVIACALFGCIVSLPLGVAYATVHHAALGRLARALAVPTHRTLASARGASIVVALTAAGLIPAIAAIAGPFRLTLDEVLPAFAVLAAVAALDIARLGIDTLRARRWLHALRTDRLPGYRLVPRAQAHVPSDLAPIGPIDDDALAVVRDSLDAPYRALPEALMLVPRR